MFAHVPAGFINDLSQFQVTCVSFPVYFSVCVCVCECHARDQRTNMRQTSTNIGRIVPNNMAAVAMEVLPFR